MFNKERCVEMGLTREELINSANEYGKTVISVIEDCSKYRVCIQMPDNLLAMGLTVGMITDLGCKAHKLGVKNAQVVGCASIHPPISFTQYMNDVHVQLYFEVPVDNALTYEVWENTISGLSDKVSELVASTLTTIEPLKLKSNKNNYETIVSFINDLRDASYVVDVVPHRISDFCWKDLEQSFTFKGSFTLLLHTPDFLTGEQIGVLSKLLNLVHTPMDKHFRMGVTCYDLLKKVVNCDYDFDLDRGALAFDCVGWTVELYGDQAAKLLPSITKAFTNVVG